MGLIVENLLSIMMDDKECMCACKEYKEIASSGKITKKCQACSRYPSIFKRAIRKIEEDIALK